MAFSRTWLFFGADAPAKWKRVIGAIAGMTLPFAERRFELILREARVEKTDAQRRLWHAVVGDLAPILGLTPGETKHLVKAEFYGSETRTVMGRAHEFVRSSEGSDREEYGRLIDFTYELAAREGINLNDRRTK